MPLEKQVVSLPVAGGLDTRLDARMLRPPDFAALDNCVFDTPGSLAQRNGFVKQTQQAPNPFTGARSLLTRRNELVMLDRFQGSTLQPSAGALEPVTNLLPRCSVKSGQVFDQFAVPSSIPAAIVSKFGPASICHVPGFYFVCHSAAGSQNAVVWYAIDDDSGAILASGSISGAHGGQCFAFGGAALLLVVDTASTALVARVIQSHSSGFAATFGGPVMGPALSLFADLGVNLTYDADDKGTGTVYLAYQSATATTIKYGAVTIDGIYVQLGTQTTAAEALSVGIGVDKASGNIGIAWSMEAATNRVDARTYNSAGAALAAAATVSTGITGGTTWRGVTCAWVSSTQLAVLFNHVTASTRSNVYLGAVNTAGTAGTPIGFSTTSQLVSRAFAMPNHTVSSYPTVYVVIGTLSALGQNSYYLCAARVAVSVFPLATQVLAGFASGQFLTAYAPPHLSRPFVLNDVVQFALMRSDPASTPYRLDSFTVTFDDADCQVSVQAAEAAFSPGGIVRAYDGRNFFEQGFLRFPEFGSAASSGTAGGLLPSTTYHYLIVFEALSATGEILQSAAVEDVSGTTGGAATSMTVNLPQFMLSNTGAAFGVTPYFAVYRREQGGIVYHLVSSRDQNVATYAAARWNLLLTETVAITDTMSEATLLSQELLPLSQGITDNIGPPACSVMAAGNGRVFLSGFDDPDLIWYSKLRETGQWLDFTDVNTIVVESGTGPITALGTIQDTLVVFRRNEIYILGGDGLDNTGTSGTFTTPRLISTGIGCVEPRSILTVAGALYFKSARGIFSLDAGGNLSFVGAKMSRYAGEPITSVVAVTAANQVRFTTASRTLVYDYELQRWTHWTIGALSSCIWQGVHVMLVDSTGTVLGETPGVYADDGLPFTMAIEPPWIDVGGAQGRQRLYQILALGKFLGTHQVKVVISYDFADGVENETRYWNPAQVIGRAEAGYGAGLYGAGIYGGLNSTGEPASPVYQFSVRPKRQKCSAFKVRLEAQALQGAGPLGAAFTLAEIAFSIGLRGDAVKLGVQRKTV